MNDHSHVRRRAWRAVMHHSDGQTVSYCGHRHRLPGHAMQCGQGMYNPMGLKVTTEVWPDD